jgi:hypothetical protein
MMPPPPPPPAGLAGVVFDATTGADIAGATVEVVDGGGNELAEVTTDDTGAFTFDDLAPGCDTLLVTAPGYVDAIPLQITVPSDTGLVIALYAVTPPVQLPAAMPAPPPDGVVGIVSDATTQAGIAGATVQLLDSDGNAWRRSPLTTVAPSRLRIYRPPRMRWSSARRDMPTPTRCRSPFRRTRVCSSHFHQVRHPLTNRPMTRRRG